jgi:hypothetical protein
MTIDEETKGTILSVMVSARSLLLTCWYDDVNSLNDPLRKKTIERKIERLDRAIKFIKSNTTDDEHD